MINNKVSDISIEEKQRVHAMQLLGDETRFKLFKLMLQNNALCVSEMANRLDITPSAVSQHFKNFELLGLVNKMRHGQRICYTLQTNSDLTKALISFTTVKVETNTVNNKE